MYGERGCRTRSARAKGLSTFEGRSGACIFPFQLARGVWCDLATPSLVR